MMKNNIYKNPLKYSKNNALQYNFAMKSLSKICFDSKSRVLDIGCGDGIITSEIAKIVHEGCVIGTDISTEMVEHASKEYLSQQNLRFVQMDAARNIFRQQFDIITSFNCLHWVQAQEAALAGIAEAAAEGAQIVLLLSHRKSTYHLVLDKLCSSDKWRQYFKDFLSPRLFLCAETYKEMVTKSGLNVIDILEEEMTYSFKTKEQLKEFFSAAGAQIKLIPDMLKNSFLDDFATEFIKQSHCHDESIPVGFWCLQVIASKPALKLDSSIDYHPKMFSRL